MSRPAARGGAPPLAPVEGYRIWATRYEAETVVSALEDRAVREHFGIPEAEVLLDAGCGTGRRLTTAAAHVSRVVGIDPVPEMIAAGRAIDPDRPPMAVADVRALPFRAGSFDLLWCRLVLGHLPRIDEAYAELRRVARPGARLIVTDFHPAAANAGHSRSFRDVSGVRHTVEHHVHDERAHRRVARRCGWAVETLVDVVPSDPERTFYAAAGRLDQWEREAGLPLVLLVCLRA